MYNSGLFRWKQQEGFAVSSTSQPVSITSALSSRILMPLINYSIKAAYNACYDGTNITLTALDNAISRGCRFIDLEVYSLEGVPIVGYSVDSTGSSLVSNSLPLVNVLNEVIGNSFTNSAPNPRDPMFIHLRINSKCSISNTTPCDVYQQIAGVIDSTLLPRLYLDDEGMAVPVSGKTILSDIMGKIILVIDASINTDYKNYIGCDSNKSDKCVALKNFINAETGGTTWRKWKYSEFINKETNKLTVDTANPMEAEPATGALSLNLVLPDIGKNVQNPTDFKNFVEMYGCQTVLYKFYNNDKGLANYEAMFNLYKTAFVPIGYVVSDTSVDE